MLAINKKIIPFLITLHVSQVMCHLSPVINANIPTQTANHKQTDVATYRQKHGDVKWLIGILLDFA